MREIEYRVWDEIEREMYIVEEINFPFKTATVIKRKNERALRVYFHTREVKLMQYIGSKDRNGVKIYEDDVIRHHSNKDKTDYIIKWHDASFGFIARPIKEKPGRPHLNQATMLSYEIVGNIYKNPELLRGEQE